MKATKPPLSLRELIELSAMAAFTVGTQVAMAALPNINLVSVLIILTMLVYGAKGFYSVAVFVLLEGLIYGFGLWFISYLYVWAILALIALIFKKNENSLIWAAIAGLFGLSFGLLCALPYLFIGGPAMAFSYWVSGIPFDLTHCVSNFVLTLLLLNPLKKLLFKLRATE
ncbi:MAG: hypothetical protein VB064_11250 [Oscillospiraceae bacterium]|nr:hypothetical protein [Oscillospiraceae bacterium]